MFFGNRAPGPPGRSRANSVLCHSPLVFASRQDFAVAIRWEPAATDRDPILGPPQRGILGRSPTPITGESPALRGLMATQ